VILHQLLRAEETADHPSGVIGAHAPLDGPTPAAANRA
jgi:hypothetical protein